MTEAIEKTINITIPRVFIKFYEKFYRRTYGFNILDSKWDIVSQELSKKEYENLFNNYISSNKYNSEQIRKFIRKYEELTHSSFIEFFYNNEWYKSFTYNLLVDKGIISLIESFEKFKEINSDEKGNNALIKYIRDYILGIHTKKAFDFFDYFFKNHSPKEAKKYGFSIDEIWLENTWYGEREIGTINIKKDFLSNTEKRKMIIWLENYIFHTRPNSYIDYIIAILNTEGIEDIFSNEELRKLYLAVCKTDNKILRYQSIREKYLLKSELEDLEKKEKEEEKNREQQEIAELENNTKKVFNSIKHKDINKILEFCQKYEYSSRTLPICYKIVKNYFKYNFSEIELNKEDIIEFNKLCNLFLKENLMTIYEYRNYMMKYIRGERLFYAKNTRAYRANRQTKSA